VEKIAIDDINVVRCYRLFTSNCFYV